MSSSSQTTVTRTTSRRTESDEEGTSYRPKSMMKSVIIQRGSGFGGRPRMSGAGGYSSFSQTRMSSGFSPAVYSQMAGTGIADFRDHREKEKREMQDCNERLATYIEKVRWLEVENKRLMAENEALKKRKQEDWRPIRDMFESELKQAREVIKDLSTQKGVSEAKLAGLQDEVDSLKDLISTYELNAKDYAKKIDQLNSQIGEYEGELNTLRMRCDSLEDELAKARALIAKYKDENARLRADLDTETAAHIEQEVLAQTLAEELEFTKELLEKVQSVQQEPIKVQGQDMEAYFKNEIRKTIRDLNDMYNDKVEHVTMECETKLAHQMDQLRSGNVRDTMEAEHSKAEVSRLRDQMSERNKRIADLESALAATRAEKDNLAARLNELQTEFDHMRDDLARRLNDANMQVEALMAEIKGLVDAKMNMEVEIACYKRLLEGEENRVGLRQLVEQSLGMRSGGASQMAEMIGQSSSSTSTFTTTTRETSRSASLLVKDVDQQDGEFVVIEQEPTALKGQDLQNLRLVQKKGGKEVRSVDLGRGPMRKLEPGKAMTIFTRSRKQTPSNDFEVIANTARFETGAVEYLIMDGSTEMCAMRIKSVSR